MFESEKDMERSRKSSARRKFLAGAGAALGGLAWWRLDGRYQGRAEAAATPKTVTIVEFTDAGERKDVMNVPVIQKPEDEWKKELPLDSFEVTRHADTEMAFTGKLLNVHDKGVFRCICCDTALYNSNTKFDSGTGWPSFWQPIAKENIVEIHDNTFGMERTAVSCRRCEAHLGHVFNDGPKPTGLRYCMNSVAMRFAKA
jgi:peptide-methionine (R)-S-oxide reductase